MSNPGAPRGPRITTRLADEYHECPPYQGCTPDCYRYYEVLADGRETGWSVRRVGTDLAEIFEPDGTAYEYLDSSDLRSALAQARRMVSAAIARAD